jgi:hypothetical protein
MRPISMAVIDGHINVVEALIKVGQRPSTRDKRTCCFIRRILVHIYFAR